MSSDWIMFVNAFRMDPNNKGMTMNQSMKEARKLWADPEIKNNFIQSIQSAKKKNKNPEPEPEKKPSKKHLPVAINDDSESSSSEEEVKPKRKYVKKVKPEPVIKDKDYYKKKYKEKYRK